MTESSYTTWRDFIVADGAIVAERFCTGSCGALVWRYFIEDRLGSAAAPWWQEIGKVRLLLG